MRSGINCLHKNGKRDYDIIMKTAAEEIKNGSIANLYLFYGEEAYKRRYYKELLKKAVAGGNTMNLSEYEGKDIDWQAVYDTSQTLPFFAEKRLLIVENCGRFKAGKNSGEEGETAEKTGSPDLLEKIIGSVPETTCLAFFEENAAKNKRIFKLIAKNGTVCECKADTEEVLINWMARGFAAAGKKVRKSTLELLTGRVGLDYDLLRREVEKLISYVGDREVVEDADVLAISSEMTESRIFDMLQAMCEKNTRKVLARYSDLLANREAPLYILAMLRMQLRTMLQVSELNRKHMNSREIARETGKPSFAVDRLIRCLRYYSAEQIEQMLEDVSETDRRCKSGEIQDQVGVELLLIRFSG